MSIILHKNINIDVGRKCQTLYHMYHLGNKSVKSAIQFTVGTNTAKLNVNVSGQTVHIYVI